MADTFGPWSRQDVLALIQTLLMLLGPLTWTAMNVYLDYRRRHIYRLESDDQELQIIRNADRPNDTVEPRYDSYTPAIKSAPAVHFQTSVRGDG